MSRLGLMIVSPIPGCSLTECSWKKMKKLQLETVLQQKLQLVCFGGQIHYCVFNVPKSNFIPIYYFPSLWLLVFSFLGGNVVFYFWEDHPFNGHFYFCTF